MTRAFLLSLTLPVADGALASVLEAIATLEAISEQARTDLSVIAEELVANVIDREAGHGGLWVTVEETASEIRLEVGDSGPGFAVDDVRQARHEPQARGLGLFIVEHFSQRWGVSSDRGFTVWAEISKS